MEQECITREKLQQMLAENKDIKFYKDSTMRDAEKCADLHYTLPPERNEDFTNRMLRESFYNASRSAYLRGWEAAIGWLELLLIAK